MQALLSGSVPEDMRKLACVDLMEMSRQTTAIMTAITETVSQITELYREHVFLTDQEIIARRETAQEAAPSTGERAWDDWGVSEGAPAERRFSSPEKQLSRAQQRSH